MKRTPLKKVSDKQKQKLKDKKALALKDKLFFQEIWNERDHVDFETGEYLGPEAHTYNFHHVYPKSKCPMLRYCKWNIVLVSLETHSKAETNLDFVPKIKAYMLSLPLRNDPINGIVIDK